MRDPERIEVLLEMIRKYWSLYPDLRFMQFLACALDAGDHFHLEDTELMKKLRTAFENDPDFSDF